VEGGGRGGCNLVSVFMGVRERGEAWLCGKECVNEGCPGGAGEGWGREKVGVGKRKGEKRVGWGGRVEEEGEWYGIFVGQDRANREVEGGGGRGESMGA